MLIFSEVVKGQSFIALSVVTDFRSPRSRCRMCRDVRIDIRVHTLNVMDASIRDEFLSPPLYSKHRDELLRVQ